MPNNPLQDPVLRAFVAETPRQQIQLDREAESPEFDPNTIGGVKDYFRNTRSLLEDYGRLPAGDYEATLRQTDVKPIRQRKKDFIPFMIRMIPPDIFPSGEITKGGQIPTPQNADVEVDVEERSQKYADSSLDMSGSLIRPDAEATGGTGTKRHLVAESETRDPETTSAQQAYRSFQKNYQRAKADIENRRTDIVEGREPVIEPGSVLEPGVGQDTDGSFDEFGRGENEAYLHRQAEEMAEVDPLFFYINPESFDKSYDKIQSNARVRGKLDEPTYVVEHWGQGQPSISASGQIGAFFVNYVNSNGEPTGGLAVDLRRGSYAYQHLMTIYQVYRQNGYLYNLHDLPSIIGAVQIFYDGAIYTGSFDSFNMSQSEDQPFMMDYDFEFTVRFEEETGDHPHV